MVTLFSLSPMSNLPNIRVGFEHGDKLVHVFFYLGMTITWYFKFTEPFPVKFLMKPLLAACAISFFYGIIIEVFQDILPVDRSSDWQDIYANTGGIILAVALLKILEGKTNWLKRKN